MQQKLKHKFTLILCILMLVSNNLPIKAQNYLNSTQQQSSKESHKSHKSHNSGRLLTSSTTLITKDIQSAMDRISANSLRGHLSFIASDLLEGRDTPSPGLDIAAEYIAAQFRRSGLESITKNSYYQISEQLFVEPLAGEPLTLKYLDQSFTSSDYQVSVINYFNRKIQINDAEIVVLSDSDIAKSTVPSNLENKVLLIPANAEINFNLVLKIAKSKALVCIRSGVKNPTDETNKSINKILKSARPITSDEKESGQSNTPIVNVEDPQILETFEKIKNNSSKATVSLNIPAPREKKITLKNVVGLLHGSDPVLKDTYVILSAHYDHLGVNNSEGDTIFNGANDDASGTSSVIEIADTLSKLKERPKRSILFITFFGEEKGLHGSEFYVKHPLVPLEKTVANINLEQLGRTDGDGKTLKDSLSMTGFDFTDLGTQFKRAGELTGVKAYKDEQYSDLFFGQSDNASFAELGIPSSTICVAYTFSDYHKVGDEADKIDYENMAKITKNIALGLIMVANNLSAPTWNEAISSTQNYVEAWKKLQGKN